MLRDIVILGIGATAGFIIACRVLETEPSYVFGKLKQII